MGLRCIFFRRKIVLLLLLLRLICKLLQFDAEHHPKSFLKDGQCRRFWPNNFRPAYPELRQFASKLGFKEAKQFQKLQTVIFCKYIKNIVHVFRFFSNLAGDKGSISLNQFAAHGTEKQLS